MEDENQAVVNKSAHLSPISAAQPTQIPRPSPRRAYSRTYIATKNKTSTRGAGPTTTCPTCSRHVTSRRTMSAVNAGGNGYYYGSIYGGLYPVDGGSIDWAYGELGVAAVPPKWVETISYRLHVYRQPRLRYNTRHMA